MKVNMVTYKKYSVGLKQKAIKYLTFELERLDEITD